MSYNTQAKIMQAFLDGKILRSTRWNSNIFAVLKDEMIVYMHAEKDNILSELRSSFDKHTLTLVVNEEFVEYPHKDPKIVWLVINDWDYERIQKGWDS